MTDHFYIPEEQLEEDNKREERNKDKEKILRALTSNGELSTTKIRDKTKIHYWKLTQEGLLEDLLKEGKIILRKAGTHSFWKIKENHVQPKGKLKNKIGR